MKTLIKYNILLLLFYFSLCSCNNEELFVGPNADVIDDNPADIPSDDNEQIDYSTTPCDFTLEGTQSGDTVIINCVMDLDGQTINLPSNITILYEGGDIINGTLNFSDNSIISGELLNSTLTLAGLNPQLKNSDFDFIPSRWGIVEGEVSQDIASKNRIIIQSIIDLTKLLGCVTFKINKLDAYFSHSLNSLSYFVAVLPSDFNLVMTDNTHLRAFPSDKKYSVILIYIQDVQNVTVTGGNLHGERDEHTGPFNIIGHLLEIRSGHNVTIENVSMSYGGADGLYVTSTLLRTDPGYSPSNNVLITGCKFDANSRNNISIVAGTDIIIENCDIKNAGIDTSKSLGIAPRLGIDIEPHGVYHWVERVTVRNNTESGSALNALIVAEGNDYLVTGNNFEKGISFQAASNVKIVDNNSGTISCGHNSAWGRAGNKNSIVSGNTISNANVGILATNQDIQIFNNKIINCLAGFQFDSLKDSHIYNNLIESNLEESDGFTGVNSADNVLIEDNIVNVKDNPINIFAVNGNDSELDYTFTFKNNTFSGGSSLTFQWTHGVVFIENETNSGIKLLGAGNNFVIDGNNIFTTGPGVEIRGETSNNLNITNNIIVCNGHGHGIYNTNGSTENKNMNFSNNTITTYTHHSGVYINNYNGILVENNIVTLNGANGNWVGGYVVSYEGDDSNFTNNLTIDGEVFENIVGNNNTTN